VLVTGLALNKVGVRLGHPSDYFETLCYVPCFVAGILLARHRHEAVAWFIRLGSGARALLLIAAILLFTYPSWMAPAWFSHAHRHHFDDILAVTLGGCAFMVWALGSQTVARFLRGRLPQFLGRISYSLYLLHAVVLLALAHALNGQVHRFALTPSSEGPHKDADSRRPTSSRLQLLMSRSRHRSRDGAGGDARS